MRDVDLPDPKEPTHRSPQERESRLFTILYSSTIFAVIYSSVHKVWIPLFLHFTHVTQTAYQQIDYWFIPAFLFLWHLWRKRSLGWLGSFLCGAFIVHGASELWFLLDGKYFGWLQISHLLGSIPLGLISIAWMTMARQRAPRAGAAWLGSTLACGLLWGLSAFSSLTSASQKDVLPGTRPNPESSSTTKMMVDPGICGQTAFRAELRSLKVASRSASVTLSPCGFAPAIQRFKSGQITLVHNRLNRTVNIHVLSFRSDGTKRGFNRILRGEETLPLPNANFKMSDDEWLLIYSDNMPDAGLSALIPENARGTIAISRTPLSMTRGESVDEL